MSSFDYQGSLFVFMAFGFGLTTIIFGWLSANHTGHDVAAALRMRDAQRERIRKLKLRVRTLEAEYDRVYIRLSKQVRIAIEQTIDSLQAYRDAFKAHSRFPDSDVELAPPLKPPNDLSSEKPPEIPALRNEERDKEGRDKK
jgi:hypothetical protein